jgi:hypothetical protein
LLFFLRKKKENVNGSLGFWLRQKLTSRMILEWVKEVRELRPFAGNGKGEQ